MAVNVINLHACGQYVVWSCLYHFKTLPCIFLAFENATWPSGHLAVKYSKNANPRVAMKFAINRKLKLPIANETIISLLFTLNQY